MKRPSVSLPLTHAVTTRSNLTQGRLDRDIGKVQPIRISEEGYPRKGCRVSLSLVDKDCTVYG